MSFWQDKRVLLTGGGGFVGQAVCDALKARGAVDVLAPRRGECDLTVEAEVDHLFGDVRPEVVLHLAGRVGGILANKNSPGEFFYENLMMGTLVLDRARRFGTQKLVALAAGCGYPLGLDVPYRESDFWSGLPDENSIGYSMAKKMLIIQSWTYREQYGFNSVILLPANLYGPHDNFDPELSHVVPGLIRRFVEAEINGEEEVVVWGTGKASREFLFVDDTACAILDAAERVNETGPFNLGTGTETSVRSLVGHLQNLVGYQGRVTWDDSKPDGQPRRYYDVTLFNQKVNAGPVTALVDGLRRTIAWYRDHRDEILQKYPENELQA